MMPMRRLLAFLRHWGGNSAVEFALVAPILLTLLQIAMMRGETGMDRSRVEHFASVLGNLRANPHSSETRNATGLLSNNRLPRLTRVLLNRPQDDPLSDISFRVTSVFEGATVGGVITPSYTFNRDSCEETRTAPRRQHPIISNWLAVNGSRHDEAIVTEVCFNEDDRLIPGPAGWFYAPLVVRRFNHNEIPEVKPPGTIDP